MTVEVITNTAGTTGDPAPPVYGLALPTEADLCRLLTARTRADMAHEAATRQYHRADDDYYQAYIGFLATGEISALDREDACVAYAYRISQRTATKTHEAHEEFYAAVSLLRRAKGR